MFRHPVGWRTGLADTRPGSQAGLATAWSGLWYKVWWLAESILYYRMSDQSSTLVVNKQGDGACLYLGL